MKWLRKDRPSGGRLPSLGQDYTEAHRRYVERVGPGGELWLRTKPFSAAPGHELRECLHTFAHIVEQLDLGIRAQVLDVGCGPGWLSEFLARCGYWVTGVDVSEGMVRIARERLAAIEQPIGEGIEALAEFHAMPVLELPWEKRFDAAILYDAMHHFDDEVETLRVIRRTLAPGGRIFIHEGVRPAPDSEGERELIEEMEQYGTLESPFDADYLLAVLGEAGFTDVKRFAAIDGLFDVSEARGELDRIETRLRYPPMNTVIASNRVPAELAEGFHALIEPSGSWQPTPDGNELSLSVTVRNAGRTFWPAGSEHGAVTIGPYLPGEDGSKVELPRVPLPRSLSSGESITADVRVPRPSVAGARAVGIDLVRERIAWFADYGSPPALVRLEDAG
ncbi:MAG TPA: class I SAM-dependent methyltransferase [Gaiellaceae bacterium]|nr:class I SAM-dependent methyltransferase [Gaiellaceae bacterium]